MRNPGVEAVSSKVLDLTRAHFMLWTEGPSRYRVVSKGSWYSHRLNRLLRTYPFGTRFVEGDEPQFTFREAELQGVFKILGIKA